MPQYGELALNAYYLIQVDAESDIEVVSVILQTKEAVLLRSYLPQTEDFFRYRDEPVFRLVEELDPATAAQFESLYAQPEEEGFEAYEEE